MRSPIRSVPFHRGQHLFVTLGGHAKECKHPRLRLDEPLEGAQLISMATLSASIECFSTVTANAIRRGPMSSR
jgi:hypothetical protein